MLCVPYVETIPAGAGFYSSVGFVLAELDAVKHSKEDTQWQQILEEKQQRTRRFVEILAALPPTVSVELHWISRPSLDPRQAGKVEIAIRLTVFDHNDNQALESCLSRFVSFQMLLDTYWTEAYFRPITDSIEMEATFRPFQPASAILVHRRRAEVVLGEPFRWTSRPPGFQTADTPPPCAAKSTVFHVAPWLASLDDGKFLLRSLMNFPSPCWIVARLSQSTGGHGLERLRQNIRTSEEFLAAGRPDQITLTFQADLLRRFCVDRLQKLTAQALRMALIIASPGITDDSLACVLGQSVSGSSTSGDGVPGFAGGFSTAAADPSLVTNPLLFPDDEPWGVDEAACAFRLPAIHWRDHDFGLPVRRSSTAMLTLRPAEEPSTALAVSHHRGDWREIRVPLEHRFKHTFLFGMTGTGKSTFLLNLLLQDLEQGYGVCLIDPHGDLADEVLARFPEGRVDDLMVLDLTDGSQIVPLNFLDWKTEEERDLALDDLYATLDRIYDFHETGGPVFESNFISALKLLLRSSPDIKPRFTLVELQHVFVNAIFRRYLMYTTNDAALKDYVTELNNTSGECSSDNISSYITSKLNRFFHDKRLRYAFGHGDLRLNFTEVLEKSRVLIIKLGAGQFGSRAAEILLGLLLSRFRSAVMARAALPRKDRKPFFFYVDEIGSLVRDENFSSLLSEARKYRVGLVAASQYAAQLKARRREPDTLDAVLGNVGTVVTFRIGVQDAEVLAPIFAPRFQQQDLIELPNFHGYIRLHLDSEAAAPASFQVQRPAQAGSADRAECLRRSALARWGVPPEECEARLRERREFIHALIKRKELI